MKLERGIEAQGIRLHLTLQSADGKSHSLMSDQVDAFQGLADLLSSIGQVRLRSILEKLENPT